MDLLDLAKVRALVPAGSIERASAQPAVGCPPHREQPGVRDGRHMRACWTESGGIGEAPAPCSLSTHSRVAAAMASVLASAVPGQSATLPNPTLTGSGDLSLSND